MIPLMIDGKHLYEIFDPENFDSAWSEEEIQEKSIDMQMFPTEVALTSETYSRDSERTADYELENLTIVNRKAKPEFTWSMIRYDYVVNLMSFLGYTYGFKNSDDEIIPVDAPTYTIRYPDFVGIRTLKAYLGQTIDGTLVEYAGVPYWENFRIAFPER